jgi:twitching motility protein PilT
MTQAGGEMLTLTVEDETGAETAPSILDQFLGIMVRSGASDLHLKVGSQPGLRISGVLSRLPGREALTSDETAALAREILGANDFARLQTTGDFDRALGIPGLGRFRVHAMMQRGTVALVFRRIPVEVPDIDQLGLPSVLKELVLKESGLVLVTGPGGSGKSTTLAAMIDYRNRTSSDHILTIEDPIEFMHSDQHAFVNQREVGTDTPSFAEGLEQALRQDPDVILVGELRDTHTIATALTAAETGHLVLASMHTTGTEQTLDRLVEVFPSEQRQQVLSQLSWVLLGIVTQVLLPHTNGGRSAAFEILVGTDEVRACVREENSRLMKTLMHAGEDKGMMRLDSCLAGLVRSGAVEINEALSKCSDPDEVRKLLGIKGGAVPGMPAGTRA